MWLRAPYVSECGGLGDADSPGVTDGGGVLNFKLERRCSGTLLETRIVCVVKVERKRQQRHV
jgi:hypothetical protein